MLSHSSLRIMGLLRIVLLALEGGSRWPQAGHCKDVPRLRHYEWLLTWSDNNHAYPWAPQRQRKAMEWHCVRREE